MPDVCTDNRFEVIAEFKKKLIEATNIESSPEEMEVLDNILFRFWQMGWLESIDRMTLVKESANTLIHSVGNSVSAKVLRNAGRFIQNAIDGKAPEFELVQASSEDNSDTISRKKAIDAVYNCDHIFIGNMPIMVIKEDAYKALTQLPSVQQERITLTEEEQRIYKKLRTFHNGSYARLLDKLFASAQSEIIYCKDCRWGKEVCGNIECFVDTNIPPEYHGYEWFCPNGERRTNEIN